MPDDLSWHVDKITKAARCLYAAGGTLEEALDAVLRGARDEWSCRIEFMNPARMMINGGQFEWPIDQSNPVAK